MIEIQLHDGTIHLTHAIAFGINEEGAAVWFPTYNLETEESELICLNTKEIMRAVVAGMKMSIDIDRGNK